MAAENYDNKKEFYGLMFWKVAARSADCAAYQIWRYSSEKVHALALPAYLYIRSKSGHPFPREFFLYL
jgi:hypothetical protein